MSNVVSIGKKQDNIHHPRISYRGLVSIMRYDPHLPRCFEGMKLNLLEGRPTILRLHAGANYPTGEYKYQIDQEGQAILVVGYDDDKQAFAIVDPFQRMHEPPAITWLLYEQLTLTMVDASSGADTQSRGLDIDVTMSETDFKLYISIGLPQVHGTIMDHDLFTLEDIKADVTLKYDGRAEESHHIAEGKYLIGSHATFEIELPSTVGGNLDISINADGLIHGNRPYDYRDAIGVDYKHTFALTQEEGERKIVNG